MVLNGVSIKQDIGTRRDAPAGTSQVWHCIKMADHKRDKRERRPTPSASLRAGLASVRGLSILRWAAAQNEAADDDRGQGQSDDPAAELAREDLRWWHFF